jgi:putative Holliday junction resolvase
VPLNEGSGASSTERWVRDYAADLTGHLPVPLTLADESFSTAEARASLQARGKRGRRVRDEIDAVAAAFILQRYLDARARVRSEHEDTAS